MIAKVASLAAVILVALATLVLVYLATNSLPVALMIAIVDLVVLVALWTLITRRQA